MFQTIEHVHEEKRGDIVIKTYTYSDGWVDSYIPSGNFHDLSKRNNNPTNQWPFLSATFEAQ